MKKIFTFNVGSSSCKFQIFSSELEELGKGLIDRIGIEGTTFEYESNNGDEIEIKQNLKFENLVDYLIKVTEENNIINWNDVYLMSHRVVNGGNVFPQNLLIEDSSTIDKLESLNNLAPLHNPFNNAVLRAMYEKFPNAKQVVVFDTAFHSTIPEINYRYAIPEEFYKDHLIRKYGAHGSSHAYITETMEEYLGRPVNIINLHLGNGASICVTKDSKSLNTSMGFTPLDGLIMGTRSGIIDPSAVLYMVNSLGIDPKEVDRILIKESGLKALSKLSSDMRDIEDAASKGNKDAQFALDAFVKRVVDIVSMYLSEIDNLDAITFTGGIGENYRDLPSIVFSQLRALKGVKLIDQKDYSKKEKVNKISTEDSSTGVYIVPTNEELFMAKEGKRLISE